MAEEGFYFQRLAAAYVRGRLPTPGSPPLDALSFAEQERLSGQTERVFSFSSGRS